MSDWVTVTKKQSKEINYSKIHNKVTKTKTNNNITRLNLENDSSELSFEEITNIFEDEYGNLIEKGICDVCRENKTNSDLLKNINACDIEYFFYNYINKEESISLKYREKSVENQEPEIYSDEDF
tara:strand:+ start:1924 stop:2298 length:375 start_codon:yes stop_codon:yes gene_type:complete